MKETKDNFSVQSEGYSKFRPIYPVALYDEILSHVRSFDNCWDCATGNGQMAIELAPHFKQLVATDISANQLAKAPKRDNISYDVERAEHTSFSENTFDLITVGQAVHWFDHQHFNIEVNRVANNGGVIALIGYGLMFGDKAFDEHLMKFYNGTLNGYWDPERKHIDEHYNSIPFPFKAIELSQSFSIDVNWNIAQLQGYLNTWSSVNKYFKQHNADPVEPFIEKLISSGIWPRNEMRDIHFPLFVKLGRIVK